ncbi:unnamed protein product [Moneuplotes crassus]|uniref:Uncharacterized protein n=1 Tax=Euplotes crassus TaxID=5936 RepID=A0AAD1UE69_EUPCR|nr:unnamed protein product [Moneuplotes crassus]
MFKSTTTRESASKIYKLPPSIQKISGASTEDPKNIPSMYHYNPSYKMVDSKIKGGVKYKLNLSVNKVLQKKKEILLNHTTNLKKKLAIKDTRTNYINSIVTKFKKCKKNYAEEEQRNQAKKNFARRNSILLVNGSDSEPMRANSLSKVNIHRNSGIKENAKADMDLQRMNSLSGLVSSYRAATEVSHKPISRKLLSNKSRVDEDIVRWCFRKVNCSFDEELNPYDLKMKLFKPSEESISTRQRCKSVTPFDKQSNRLPLRADMDCNEKRFEVNTSNINVLSSGRKSPSPNFNKYTSRKDIIEPPINMHTYDANYEYSKRSLGKVPDFKRYISRPSQEKEILCQEAYKPLDEIFSSLKKKDKTVPFKHQRPRDDLMYKHENISRQGRKSILDGASLRARKINF